MAPTPHFAAASPEASHLRTWSNQSASSGSSDLAAALSAATTILSFASLSAAGNQGIRSMGLLIVLGLSLVTLAAFTAVPLGWMTTWRMRKQVPLPPEE